MHDQAQVLLKPSCTLGKLVNTQIKGITLLCIGKINICISCVFNGFKYSYQVKFITASYILAKRFHSNECFEKNYSSFLDFTCNYKRTSGIFVPC